ncbi:hypothetical protein JCM3765_000987 [Sporobolomyces pararoseus]
MPPPKRRLTGSQASSQSSTTSSAKPPPAKRVRREEPKSHQPTSADPSTSAPTAPAATSETQDASSKLPLPVPTKRVIHPGSLRRLSSGHPSKSSTSNSKKGGPSKDPQLQTRATQTLSGNRIGGKSKDLKDGLKQEEIWVHSKGARLGKGKEGNGRGMGFSAWLKRGVGAFVERGCTCLKVHGMGATISTALSLALAIREAVPGGSPIVSSEEQDETGDTSDSESDGGEYDPEKEKVKQATKPRGVPSRGIFKMEVRTGTTVVGDEITPEDDDEDMIYQSRSKSTVEIVLTLDEELGKLVGVGRKLQQRGGNSSTRGGKRRAAGGARGRGRGRGRGQ